MHFSSMVIEFLRPLQLAFYMFILPNFFSLHFVNYSRRYFAALSLKTLNSIAFLSCINSLDYQILVWWWHVIFSKINMVLSLVKGHLKALGYFGWSRIVFFWYTKFHFLTTLCLSVIDFCFVLWNSIVLWQAWDRWISKSPWIYHT